MRYYPKASPPSNKNVAKIINSDLVLVRAAHQKTTLNKPIAVGFSTNSNSYAICHILSSLSRDAMQARPAIMQRVCLSVCVCVPSIHAWMSACQSYAQHTFFCLDYFASICCYIIRIAMCPSIYLSHSYTQCLPCVSVSLSPHLPLILRHYVGIACVQLCSSVCHTHVSTLTVY